MGPGILERDAELAVLAETAAAAAAARERIADAGLAGRVRFEVASAQDLGGAHRGVPRGAEGAPRGMAVRLDR